MREKKESSFFSTVEKLSRMFFCDPGDYDRISSTGGKQGVSGNLKGFGGFSDTGYRESIYREEGFVTENSD